ncbi:MAG: substrate-binding periplasmic protein [Rhodospirillaceae bacterium]
MGLRKLALGLLGGIGLCALGVSDQADARPLDTVMESGTITIGVYRDLPPYSTNDGSGVKGIDVEVGAELARRMGLKVAYLELTADENLDDDLRNGVWKGSVVGGGVADVMLHMPADRQVDARNELAVLFGAYHRERFMLAYDAQVAGEQPTLPLFAHDLKIGAELDTLPDIFLSGAMGGRLLSNVRRDASVEGAVARMIDGELAAVMGEETRLRAALKDQDPERYKVGSMPMPGFAVTGWDLGTAVKSDSRDLGYKVRRLLDDMEEDGTLERIFAAHGAIWRKPER